MDKELEKYFEDQLTLFNSQGFKDLIEKVKELRELYGDIRRPKTSDEFFYSKGQVDILDWLIDWENQVRINLAANE